MVQTKRLLVIEDDLNLTLALYRALSHTYKVDTSKTAASGIKKVSSLPLDLIILDLNLPDLNGIKVTKHIRNLGINTPIIVLSGNSELASKVDLLDLGANDYLTKPFSLAELKARIRAHLRQTAYPVRAALSSGDLILDPKTRQLIRNGRGIYLRKKEYSMFECLMINAGTAVSRNYLMRYAWGDKADIKTNSIEVHINSLRQKVDVDQQNQIIKTVHGLGYVLDSPKPKARTR